VESEKNTQKIGLETVVAGILILLLVGFFFVGLSQGA